MDAPTYKLEKIGDNLFRLIGPERTEKLKGEQAVVNHINRFDIRNVQGIDSLPEFFFNQLKP